MACHSPFERGQRYLGLLQRGNVHRLLQPEVVADRGHVLEHRLDTAVIGLEEAFQNETGEQLRPGELLGSKAMRVRCQSILAYAMSRVRHLPW